MHPAARDAVARAVAALQLHAEPLPLTILDVGGRDVNGHVRDLFPEALWTALDALAGPGVGILADITTWAPVRTWDVVISTETLEHVDGWPAAVATMAKALRPGGAMILTAATDPRLPHSGFDGGAVHPGEFYGNVDAGELRRVLVELGVTVEVDVSCEGDVYAWGRSLVTAPARNR